MTDLQIPLPDQTATEECAQKLAPLLRPGDVVLLEGVVGAGKSTFARALIRAMTHPLQEVPSPSFTLVQSYDTDHGPLWHADLYRLGDMSELEELGLFDAFDDAICLIEWPGRLGAERPTRYIEMNLHIPDPLEDTRIAYVTFAGAWPRLEGVLN